MTTDTNVAGSTSKTFKLKFPFTSGGTNYAQLTRRRPKVKDTRLLNDKVDTDPIGAQSDFLAQLATVPPDVIEELDLEDMATIRKWVEGFTKNIEK